MTAFFNFVGMLVSDIFGSDFGRIVIAPFIDMVTD